MAQFKVVIDFSTNVSEDTADELEILVAEFVQLVMSVVMNDELDEVSANMNPAGILRYVGSDAPISAADFEDDGPTDFDRR